ncbi:outer membrane beta-barrel protein [Dysgonomonas sp. Marseille-P4677]|uniref:outer membrane beta-barrel family protein n=1 Tax=Dysgonomonas sp. Marseille-P4677 TaxID=2364790 RepID=UPI001914380B|nr:outer membrane beta-barrel family protein [Dysgonomonas sp. Marseille-P4677]MBK5720177.1 outer membrane beta-barrel protein [Dysgonomonas sp. Marseille-P4677]
MMKSNRLPTALFIFSFLLLSCTLCYSQNFNVKGRVLDVTGKPIEYINIVFLNMPDSLYCGGTVTDSLGNFNFSAKEAHFLVEFSLIGYNTVQRSFSLENDIDLGNITITENVYDLSEITVTAVRPQFRMTNGNLVTNVDNTLLSTVGTANDILEHIPGISTKGSSGITVFGKGVPVIYINNRKLYNSQELDQLQSSDILSIELLNNPGSKYDSENKAVIIIKTKPKSLGFSANISERIRVGNYIGNTENINLTYTNNKFSAYFSYYHHYLKNKTQEKSSYQIYTDTLWGQYINQPYIYMDNTHDLSASFDYSFTMGHIAGMKYQGTFSSSKNTLNGDESFYANDNLEESIISRTLQTQKPNTHLLNAFYDGQLNDKFRLHFDMDYIQKKSPSNQVTEEKSSIATNSRKVTINSESDFKLIAGKMTAAYAFKENSQIELGTEYNIIKGKGFYTNNADLSKSNIYTNDEEKIAGFISYKTVIKDYQIGLGLRYEYAHEKATEDSIKIVRVNKHYSNIYPNITLSKNFRKVNMSLNTNGRTRRPTFSELNSNDLYLNPYLTQKGNPYLKKEDYYEVNYNLMYKILNVSMGYSYVKNPIGIDFLQDENSSANTILTYKNYDKYQNFNILATINYSLEFWRPQLTVGMTKPFFTTMYRDEKSVRNKTSYNIEFYNHFVLPKDYTISVYFTHQSDYDSYMTRWNGYTEMDLRIRKSLFDKTLTLNLYINDIFNRKKDVNNTYIGKHNLTIDRKRESLYATFSIQYIFNNSKKRYQGQNASSDDIDRL